MSLAIWRQTGSDPDGMQWSEGDATLTGMVQKKEMRKLKQWVELALPRIFSIKREQRNESVTEKKEQEEFVFKMAFLAQ